MFPLYFYAIVSVILLFLVAYFKLDIGPMRTHEKRAEETGELLNPAQKNVPGDLGGTFSPHKDGKVYHLLVPIGVLLVATVGSMFVTGAIEIGRASCRVGCSGRGGTVDEANGM